MLLHGRSAMTGSWLVHVRVYPRWYTDGTPFLGHTDLGLVIPDLGLAIPDLGLDLGQI